MKFFSWQRVTKVLNYRWYREGTNRSGVIATPVVVRSFTSPTLVLLSSDWPDGDAKADFLGSAIERTPGFGRQSME
jgi:hypothetical protein